MIAELQMLEKPIRVVITGMGAMGKGLLYQTTVTPGIECVGVADLDVEKAIAGVRDIGLTPRTADTRRDLQGVRKGEVAVCQDGMMLSGMEEADVLIESTTAIAAGAKFVLSALEHGKHVILRNSEVDLIFGPYLMKRAHELGLVYTSCDGDQHGTIKRLIDDMRLWGFELVMGGNIKGFLDRYSNPTKIIPEADKRNLDYRMCTAFTDGTKLSIEMALLANALGMKCDKPGMHGPTAEHVNDAFGVFDFESLWDRQTPVVDYLLGAQPDGGVYAIGYCDHPYQRSLLNYFKMGDGPFYLFYRPYHLCNIESMQGVVDAFLHKKSLLQPEAGFRTNVFAYAKSDLRTGDALDGLGGYKCYGLIDNCPTNDIPEGLPICLADDVRLIRDVAKDQPILLSDIQVEPGRFDFDIYYKALGATGLMDHIAPPHNGNGAWSFLQQVAPSAG